MASFELYNSTKHMDDFYQMNLESMTWHQVELLEKYQIDITELLGLTAQDFVDNTIGQYLDLKPPEGAEMLLIVDNQVAGMLALTKIDDDTGELHRMWIRTKYRGKGLSKQLLKKVLRMGTDLGLSKILLSTPKFAAAAQHLYKSSGFMEIPEYPETEGASTLRHLWVYMEKTLS
jgi:ribosomal protein S18 acetylase RimI-like enzyme